MLSAGVRVKFNCTADGVPTPSITWLKDSSIVSAAAGKKYELTEEKISNGLRQNINESVTSILTVVGISEGDTGLYICTASNGRGQNYVLDVPYNLTVIPMPPPNFCENNPCRNGGTCESGAITYVCKCATGYKGATCDEGRYN